MRATLPEDLSDRIEAVLAQLTLEEKAALTVGRDAWTTAPVERLGVPSVWMSDGPTGLRKVRQANSIAIHDNVPATCFPTASALGASWDVDLVRAVGGAIAAEAQAQDVQALLAPGLNLKRSPLCGRNFEYFSEDPVLTGHLAAAFVSGLQANGVGGCLKHFAANESETDRMIVSSEVDERTLRELYLRPFEIAVADAQPWMVMCGYNRLNGLHCAEHAWLLNDVLVEEWGFQGIVVSDWLAVNDRPAGVEAGLHLQMPTAPTAPSVVAAVQAGQLSAERLDAVVRRLLRFIFVADANRRPQLTPDLDAHHALARRAAAECAVLLKNDGGVLPLQGAALRRVAVIGQFAQSPRYQGAGSSQVTTWCPVDTAFDMLSELVDAPEPLGYAAGYADDGSTDAALLSQAQAAARGASAAVVVVGLPPAFEEEGRDRTHLDLPAGHNDLVEAVLAVQPNTVVVVVAGSAVVLPWIERAPAVLLAWLGGQAGGGAIADVLVGRVNPSGKLSETFPRRLEDTAAFLSFPDDGQGRVPFTEGLFTGYRWHDARRLEPLFAFGHGLSYTTFEYRDLHLEPAELAAGGSVTVSFTLRNTGPRPGQEVVQVYVTDENPRLPRPRQELKAFAKVALAPGEARTVSLVLGPREFAHYDPRLAAWVAAPGSYTVRVGASSRDHRLEGQVMLAGEVPPVPVTALTPLREWLKHPASKAALWPALVAQLRQFGAAPETLDGPAGEALMGFLGDIPVGKLVVTGALTTSELNAMVEKANRER